MRDGGESVEKRRRLEEGTGASFGGESVCGSVNRAAAGERDGGEGGRVAVLVGGGGEGKGAASRTGRGARGRDVRGAVRGRGREGKVGQQLHHKKKWWYPASVTLRYIGPQLTSDPKN